MVTRIAKGSWQLILLLAFTVILTASCSRLLGYGVLLWSTEDPPVPSGTVLPVYIKSNIDHVWVVGIPKEFRTAKDRIDKFEIPLYKLELLGSRKKAQVQAQDFAPYALLYAEALQDGLPIRENPDNSARRVYRLKLGEIIKILASAKNGTTAVGTTGDPLPGEWYKVLTEDGTTGYCFSYRLNVFEHQGGAFTAIHNEEQEAPDPVLERLLARTWSPESYGTMVNNRRINLDEFSPHWCFDPGQETGVAVIKTKDLDRSFPYTKIRSTGTQSWVFDGSQLQMSLRSDTTLAVQFPESSGILRTLLFVALPSAVDDIILQETARRETLFKAIYDLGPVYTSNNYGTLTFQEDGHFTWVGNRLLVPQVIPATALGSGFLDMRLFLSNTLANLYAGAFTLHFDRIGGDEITADFMYSLDSQGFRIEYVPQTSLDDVTVMRRASSPLVIYFFKSENSDTTSYFDYSTPVPSPGGNFGSAANGSVGNSSTGSGSVGNNSAGNSSAGNNSPPDSAEYQVPGNQEYVPQNQPNPDSAGDDTQPPSDY